MSAPAEVGTSVQQASPGGASDEGSAPVPELAAPTNAEPSAEPAQSAAAVSTPAPERTVINPPLKFALKSLDPEHPYLKDRGFSPDTIATFRVGYCTGKGIMAGRIAIPIHNEQGELVAYAGRWPGEPPEEEGKYKLPTGFHKSYVVYNLHRAKELAKEKGLIVVEGFFDAMRLHEAGVRNVVALMGSSLSDVQERLIVESVGPGGKVALMFDEDEAGWKGREEVLSRLSGRVYVRVIGLGEEGTQPDGLGADAIQTLLA
jgi:DNA primase